MSMTSTPSPDSITNNPLQSALLASLMNRQGSGVDLEGLLAAQAGGTQATAPDLASLLGAQTTGGDAPMDERLQAALRWLEQRRSAEQQAEPVEATPGEAELELLRLEEMQRQHEQEAEQRERERELKTLTDALYAELEALRTRNDTLAAALGACYLCFGEDPTCSECRGNGRPGALPPAPKPYRRYVAPAVARVREIRSWTPGREKEAIS